MHSFCQPRPNFAQMLPRACDSAPSNAYVELRFQRARSRTFSRRSFYLSFSHSHLAHPSQGHERSDGRILAFASVPSGSSPRIGCTWSQMDRHGWWSGRSHVYHHSEIVARTAPDRSSRSGWPHDQSTFLTSRRSGGPRELVSSTVCLPRLHSAQGASLRAPCPQAGPHHRR